MTPDRAESVTSCANDQAVWPWQVEPYKLWSLLDMVRHYAGNWLAVTHNLDKLRWMHALAPTQHVALEQLEKYQSQMFSELETESADLPFSHSLRKQLARLKDKALEASDTAEHEWVVALFDEFGYNVQAELETSLFLCVPPNHKQYFEQPIDEFGPAIVTTFPESRRDVISACRCLALEQSMATVFHLMRVLEHGLRLMAARFNVSFATDSWHKVLKGIEDSITELRNKGGLTERERKEITYYSEAASQFRHFKDAWRNHVSHGREFFDQNDAESAFRHVRELMLHLTTTVSGDA